MIQFNTVAELVKLAEEKELPIHDIVIAREMHDTQRPKQAILNEMQHNWEVMQASIERGIENEERSVSGLTGGDAEKIYEHREGGYLGTAALSAAAYAVGVSEVNAVMGRIVACPTAGSCGIVPAALYAAREQRHVTDEAIVGALFTAAGIGMVIDQNASIAGAEGGCQAECGAAAGMAAAALVELADGTPAQIANACALAIKNLLGLACGIPANQRHLGSDKSPEGKHQQVFKEDQRSGLFIIQKSKSFSEEHVIKHSAADEQEHPGACDSAEHCGRDRLLPTLELHACSHSRYVQPEMRTHQHE